MTIAILVREIGITVLRFVVLRQGVIPASHGGKIKTVVQMLAVVLYVLFPDGAMHTVAEITMGLALVITVVTGIEYVMVASRMRRKLRRRRCAATCVTDERPRRDRGARACSRRAARRWPLPSR